jgi:uncharacterized protein YkwD
MPVPPPRTITPTPVAAGHAARRLAGLVALVFALASILTLTHPGSTLAWGESAFSSSSEKELIALSNRSRASAGLRALRVDSTLSSVARWRSKDMIERGYFSHSIPGYGSVFDKLDARGYCYKVAGENIGWNTNPDGSATAAIHRMFMESSGHRKNILGRSWDAIGIGAYQGADGKKMWTVLFADKCGGSTVVAKPKPKPQPKATPKPKPRATPKPKPRATPKPTPVPTPTPLDTSPDRFEPSHEPAVPNGLSGAKPQGSPNPAGSTATSLRVGARPASSGLLETIVGGVAGYFFGA